jgi:biopolymer transport protein ExbD
MQDPGTFSLARHRPPKALISLVPMIDVMLILLVFFMVTSTYLNLDMIPAVKRTDDPSQAAPQSTEGAGTTLMIRIGADGIPTLRGVGMEIPALEALFVDRIQSSPALRVLVLPSGAANMQALVSVLDAATRAGVTNLRVVRLEVAE